MNYSLYIGKRKKSGNKKLLAILLVPLAFLIKWLMSLNPAFTEKYYSRGLYPLIMKPLSKLTGLIPVSIAEILILFAILYILIKIVYLIAVKRPDKKSDILSFFINIIMIVSLLIFIQTIVWSINYERMSFAENAGINVRDSSVDELEALCRKLIENTNMLREQVSEDLDGVMTVDGGFKSLAERAQLGYDEVSKLYPFLAGKYGRPKPVLLSRLMSHTNIIGIFTGLTGEANVDTDITDMELPSTIMHEKAHQHGFAHEDEANYIAYIACMNHPDADFKYSGSVLALQHSMNALYSADSDRYFELMKLYSDAYQRDLKKQYEYWKQFQGPTRDVADKINDTYLKLNGIQDGTKSYGRMVDLLLAEYRENGTI